MKAVAEVVEIGGSQAVRLPSNLRVRAKELTVEVQDDGEILLYDPVARDRAFEQRLAALRAFTEEPVLAAES